MELSVECIKIMGLKLEMADMVSQKVPDFEERMNESSTFDGSVQCQGRRFLRYYFKLFGAPKVTSVVSICTTTGIV
jgi:hypothetical protein